jgi:hypothetical protein
VDQLQVQQPIFTHNNVGTQSVEVALDTALKVTPPHRGGGSCIPRTKIHSHSGSIFYILSHKFFIIYHLGWESLLSALTATAPSLHVIR